MKAQIWQRAAGTIVLACFSSRLMAADDAQPTPPQTKVAPPAISVPAATTSNAPTVVATNADAIRVIQMPKLSLPPTLDQVVKLSQSGADESVIRAYVEKAAPPYRITGNEIVQLRDLGISQGVIMALIEHSTSAPAGGTTEMIGPQSPPEPQPAQTNVAEAPLSEDVAPFYDTLSPFGAWYDVPGYGWSWQPSVVVVNPGWRPYCDNGYWLWSDYGWYWNSYYSWGWAPFHYGRWYSHASRGWFWCPDRTWGASWVSWRNSGRYCGWAPLPPGAHFRAGHGWTYRGARVGADFDFGIRADRFNFVEHGRFTDRQVARHTLGARDGQNVFQRSTGANNYVAGANNRIINHGVGRDTIAAASQTPVRNVSVQELPRGAAATMPDRVSRIGSTEVVYRPGAQISVPRTTTASAPANRSTAPMARAPATRVNPNPALNQRVQTQSRPSFSGNAAGRQVFPNTAMTSPNRSSVAVQPRQGGNVLSAPRTASPPSGQNQNRVYARPSSPAYAPRATAPAANVQRFSAPSAGRLSAPSSGGQYRGNVSRGGGGGGGSASRGGSGGGVSHGLRR